MLRACCRCGKVHEASYKCLAQVLPRTKEQTLRNKHKWRVKSEEVRERSFHLCEVCIDRGDLSIKPVEVHHISKLRDEPGKLLDDSNLITLCVEHHKQADRGEIKADYLRELAKKRDERY